MKQYMLKRYHQRRKLAFDIIGRVCAKCNLTCSDSDLELDHINPAEKILDFARDWSVSLEVYLAEVKKAQPLCKPCHIDKSIIDANKTKATHGTLVMYKHYKCRCNLCKEANRITSAKYKKKKKSS